VSTAQFGAPPLGGPSPAAAGHRPQRTELWLLGAIIALAAVIRIVVLNNQSLWADEALTAYEARLSLSSMLHVVRTVEVTPPLYFVLVWGWAKVIGAGPEALRALSAIAGIALVPVSYAATRELVSRRAGLVAAALMAVNPFAIWYSQEARAYVLLALLTGAAFLFCARSLRAPTWRNLTAWALLGALALATHFFAGFAIAPQAILLLRRHRTRATVLAVGVVGAAQLAMLPLAVSDTSASHGTGWIAKVPLTHRIAITAVEWVAGNLYRRTTLADGLALGAGLIVIGGLLLWFGRREGEPGPGVMVAIAVAACVFIGPLILAGLGQDYFLSRNAIPALVPAVTVLAAVCTVPRLARAGAVVAVLLFAGFAAATTEIQTHPFLQRPDWRRVARALGPATSARAVLAADGTTAQALKIYLPGVAWAQPVNRRVLLSEIDVVGATKRIALASEHTPTDRDAVGVIRLPTSRSRRGRRGATVPRSIAPAGTRLIFRGRVANWIIARYRLDRPRRISIAALARSAPRYFRHTPAALLVFTQPRGHG
jgi:mannosyltransferase